MDCIVCLEGEARPVSMRFTNGDTNTLYLCEGCIEGYGSNPFVAEIRPYNVV